jgi:cellulose synthase (UDP-forming)
MNDTLPTLTHLKKDFLVSPKDPRMTKFLLSINAFLAVLYFIAICFFFPIGNPLLFALLIFGEVFHVFQVLTFIYSVWDTTYQAQKFPKHAPSVDIFVTVAGEPVEIVRETVAAAKAMRYSGHFTVNILNDGFVAKKDNWHEIELLAKELEVNCITRQVAGGFKAGNINNGLAQTTGDLVAIFDADHVPYPSFLEKTVTYFGDAKVGFVQAPQFYKNYHDNVVTQSSWEQQELFFGPICKGRARHGAVTMCGTNMVLNRKALQEVGGMCTESIAEDFVTGLFIHERGYTSVYVPEVLAEGLATEDLLTYSKQQFRWARGALDVIFHYNPLTRKGLTWPQRIEYLSGASFFLSGTIIVLDAILPLIFFFTGQVALHISGMFLASIFLPYLFFTLYMIQRSTNFTFTFRSMAFSIGAFSIQIDALLAALTGTKNSFVITKKEKGGATGNFFPIVRFHILYAVVMVLGIGVALAREGLDASVVNNIAWASINLVLFSPFVHAAFSKRATAAEKETSSDLMRNAVSLHAEKQSVTMPVGIIQVRSAQSVS